MDIRKVTSKNLVVTINGMTAVNADIDQHRPLVNSEKALGRKLAYIDQWNDWEVYAPEGSALAVAKETYTALFNQAIIDLALRARGKRNASEKYVAPEVAEENEYFDKLAKGCEKAFARVATGKAQVKIKRK